ncbi:hypothetical protein [Phenylobacterium sp.]|uniref:hypothetical protein n=1 Tax=Phenylobacterium sp. TaxID=1871053 RepID=UPI0039424D6E
MRLIALAAATAVFAVPAVANAQVADPAERPAFVNVDEPAFCNAAGLADPREQASGFAIPADKGGGQLVFVDKVQAQCQQVVGGKPTGQLKRPTICPLGAGRILKDGAWICRSQKLAGK